MSQKSDLQNMKTEIISEKLNTSPSQKQKQKKQYNYEYFKQVLTLRLYRKQIQKKMIELNQKRQVIFRKVVYFQKKTQEQFRDYIRGQAPERKKRNRRNADEIKRNYDCPNCGKRYGSEGSMNQHIKIKHPHYYQPKKKSTKNSSQSMMGDQSYS